MAGRLSGIIFFILFIGYLFVESAIDEALFAKKLPEIASPDSARYSVDVYKPSKVIDHGHEVGDDYGVYSWELQAEYPVDQVKAFYDRRLPSGSLKEQDEGVYHYEYVPSGASGQETTTITLAADGSQTRVMIVQNVDPGGVKIPWSIRKWLIRGSLLLLIVGGLALIQGPLTRMAVAKAGDQVASAGGLQFQKIAQAPPEADQCGLWLDATRELEDRNFVKAFDFTSPSVKATNYCRLLHRDRKTWAVLYFLDQGGGKTYAYPELMTLYSDGTTYTTTASKHVGKLKRPQKYPLQVIPEGMDIQAVLTSHERGSMKHAGGNRQAIAIEPDQVFEVWREVEKMLHQYRKSGGDMNREGLMRIVNAANEQAASEAQQHASAAQSAEAVERDTFTDEVKAQLAQNYAETKTLLEGFMLVVKKPGTLPMEIDIEPLYYLWKRPGVDRQQAIKTFLLKHLPS